MSKRKTIDAFFKKKDVSNSKFRTLVVVKINVDTSMPNEHPSKCSRIQSEEIDRDPGSLKQICEFPINKQDEIRRVYLKESPYQPKNIDCPYNDDNHRRRKSTSHVKNLGYAPSSKINPPCKKSWLRPWSGFRAIHQATSIILLFI